MVTSIFDIQAGGVKETAAALGSINNSLYETASATESIAKIGGVAGAVSGGGARTKLLEQLNDEMDKNRRILGLIQAKMQSVERLDSWRRLEKAAEKYRKELNKLEIDQDRLTRKRKNDRPSRMDEFADMGGGLGFGMGGGASMMFRSFTQGVGALGYDNAIAGSIQGINQFLDTMDSMQMGLREVMHTSRRYGDILKDVGGTLRAVGNRSISAKAGLSSMVSAIGPMTLAAVGVTATVAMWTRVFEELEAQAQKAREEVQRYVEDMRKRGEFELELSKMVASGSADAMRERIKEAELNLALRRSEVARLQELVEATDAAYAALGEAFNPGERSRLGASGQELRAQLAEVSAGLLDMETDLAGLLRRVGEAEDVQRANEALERVKDAEDDLTQTRLSAAEAARGYDRSLREFEERSNRDRTRELADRYIADRRATNEHMRDLAKIRSDGYKRIQDAEEGHLDDLARARADFNKSQARAEKQRQKEEARALKQLTKSLLAIDTDLQKSIAGANENYMKSEIKALEAHLKDMGRAEAEYNKQRKRRLEDLHDDLLAAEMANDVNAFIMAQNAAEKDLRRMKEDYGDQRSEAQQRFDEERAESRKEHLLSLDDMRKQADERRQEMRAQFAEDRAERAAEFAEQQAEAREEYDERLREMRAAHLKRLDEERKQTRESLEQARAAFEERRALEAEDRALADLRRSEDLARELQQMKNQFEEEMKALEAREADNLQVIRSGGTWQRAAVTYAQLALVSEYRAGAQRAVAAVRQSMAALSALNATYANTRAAAGGGGVRNRALGGPLAAGQWSFVNEKMGQRESFNDVLLPRGMGMFIPFEHGRVDAAPSGADGSGITMNFGNVDLGGISSSEFHEGMERLGRQLVNVVRQAQQGVRAPLQ